MMSAHGPEMAAAAKRLPNIVAAIEKPFFSKQLVDLVQRALSAPRKQVPPLRTAEATTQTAKAAEESAARDGGRFLCGFRGLRCSFRCSQRRHLLSRRAPRAIAKVCQQTEE